MKLILENWQNFVNEQELNENTQNIPKFLDALKNAKTVAEVDEVHVKFNSILPHNYRASDFVNKRKKELEAGGTQAKQPDLKRILHSMKATFRKNSKAKLI